MQVQVQQLSPVLVEFQVEVPADRVKTEVDKAYQTLQKTARVRGFRPGKAPRDVLTHLYGDRIVLDVAQRLVDDTLPKALSEKNVQPLSQPAIEPQKLARGHQLLVQGALRGSARDRQREIRRLRGEAPEPHGHRRDDRRGARKPSQSARHALAPRAARAPRKRATCSRSRSRSTWRASAVPEAAGDNVQVELGAGPVPARARRRAHWASVGRRQRDQAHLRRQPRAPRFPQQARASSASSLRNERTRSTRARRRLRQGRGHLQDPRRAQSRREGQDRKGPQAKGRRRGRRAARGQAGRGQPHPVPAEPRRAAVPDDGARDRPAGAPQRASRFRATKSSTRASTPTPR